jgi:serralysin
MAIVNGTTGDDLLTGTSDADTITGDAGADTISGGAGADTINAGDGNDIVSGGKGRDEVYLGSGDDVWLLQDDEVVLNVNYGSWGASSVFDVADGGDGYDKLWLMSSSSEINLDVSNADISGFESLWLIGSGYSDGRKARLTDTQLSSLLSLTIIQTT